jgi:hypothetical protein
VKKVRLFAALLGVLVFIAGCELFLNQPEKDAVSGAELEVELARAPHLNVRMEIVPDSGIANPSVGLIVLPDNRPKQKVPFTASFAVSTGFGFVEWRAYRSSSTVKDETSKLGSEVEFKSLNASGTEVEIKILINEEITIIPFCAALPYVPEHNLPNMTFNRLPTNYPVDIKFNVPVDPDSLSFITPDNPGGTILITGQADWGQSSTIRNLADYFDLQVDEKGMWLRLEPLNNGTALGYFNIALELNTGIKHKNYPLYMAATRLFTYAVSDGPDVELPVVNSSYIHGALGNGGTDVFFPGKTVSYNSLNHSWPTEYALKTDESNKRKVYLFFDAYKALGTIKDITITEERIMDIGGQIVTGEIRVIDPPYPNDDLRDSDSVLALQFMTEHGKAPLVIPHIVQTEKEGVIRFYIQPKDSFGLGYSYAEAQSRSLYVEAVLDLPPGPVSGTRGTYNRSAGTIVLNWNDPANIDVDHIAITWDGGSAEAAFGAKSKTLSSMAEGSYTFTLTAVDRGGNSSAPVSFPFIADSTAPIPVNGFSALYEPGSQRIKLSWTNPVENDAETIKITWSGTEIGSASPSVNGSGTTQEYYIENIVPTDGAIYTISVRTANSLKESGEVLATIYPDNTPPLSVTNLNASYSPAGTISLTWDDPIPSVGDLQKIRLEWGITGEPASGNTELNAGQQSYVISGVVADPRGYTVKAFAIDRAENESAPASKQVVTDIIPPGSVASLLGIYDQAAGKITITWTDPVDSDLNKIRLSYRLGSGTWTNLSLDKGTGTYTISPVIYNSGQYTITVTALDLVGNEGSPETVEVRTDNKPAVPGSIQVSSTTNSGELTVSWNQVSSATDYTVRYGTSSNASGAQTVDIIGGATLNKTLGGLTNGTLYYVWVLAKNGGVSGDYNAVPLTGTPRNNAALLSSLSVNSEGVSEFNENTFINYTHVVPNDSGYITITGVPTDINGTVSYKFGGADSTGSYSSSNNTNAMNSGVSLPVYIKVTAENGVTNNIYTVTVTRKLAVPAGLTVNRVAGSFGQLAVSWAPVTGAIKYTVAYKKTDDGDTPEDALTKLVENATTGTLTGLTPGAAYYVWVEAGNSIPAAEGEYSPIATGTVNQNIASLGSLILNGSPVSNFDPGPSTVILESTVSSFTVTGIADNSGTVKYKIGTGNYGSLNTGTVSPGTSLTVIVKAVSEDSVEETEYTITVYRPNTVTGGISGLEEKISLSPPGLVSLSWRANAGQIFTVSGSDDTASIRWFVDGELKGTSNGSTTFTVTPRNYLLKTYKLTVMAQKDELLYSRDVEFTITE